MFCTIFPQSPSNFLAFPTTSFPPVTCFVCWRNENFSIIHSFQLWGFLLFPSSIWIINLHIIILFIFTWVVMRKNKGSKEKSQIFFSFLRSVYCCSCLWIISFLLKIGSKTKEKCLRVGKQVKSVARRLFSKLDRISDKQTRSCVDFVTRCQWCLIRLDWKATPVRRSRKVLYLPSSSIDPNYWNALKTSGIVCFGARRY